MTPSVSVVITAYNQAEYLAQAVHSVFSQTLSPGEGLIECIVVDDGSTDHTPAVAAALAEDYPSLQVVHQPNQGVSAARNAGAARVSGTWMQFLDADDWLHPDKIRQQLAALSTGPAAPGEVILYSDYERVYVDEKGNPVRSHPCPVQERSPDELMQRILICPDYLADSPFPLLQQAMLLPTSLVRRQPFNPQRKACEDREFVLDLLMAGIPFRHVPITAAYYRKHRANLTDNTPLMRDSYLGFFEQVMVRYPQLQPRLQLSSHHLLEKAIEAKDAATVARLAPMVTFPVRLLNDTITVHHPLLINALFRLRCLLPDFLLYPHRRGPRSQRLFKTLEKLGRQRLPAAALQKRTGKPTPLTRPTEKSANR
ncbi:MAG: glycosyltransferase family 2 protein [Synechococcales bacterium]|nr:glycosyltransferase family 2 protein [Synechococcales bacterium]